MRGVHVRGLGIRVNGLNVLGIWALTTDLSTGWELAIS